MRSLLETSTHHLATLWLLERRDGTRFRICDHDREIDFESQTFEPSGGASATASQRQGGLEGGDRQLRGIIDSDKITAIDLFLGKYRETFVTEWVVDWRFPWQGHFAKEKLWIVSSDFSEDGWQFDVSSSAWWLRHEVGFNATRECPYDVGDVLCGVDLSTLAVFGVGVNTVTSNAEFNANLADISAGLGDDYFRDGELLWTTGSNAGLPQEIRDYVSSTRSFKLHLETPYPIVGGDEFVVKPGCDKTTAVCSTRFSNLARCGCLPFLPGLGKMIRNPRNASA